MLVISWHLTKPNSIECSILGSEFVSAKAAMETNRALQYKLRMMGISIDGPTYMLCNNISVVNNTTALESVLKKKSNSIAYHAVPEAVAMQELLIVDVKSEDHLADVMTKVLPNGAKRDNLIQGMLWDIGYQV
jgi:hypothetical protein